MWSYDDEFHWHEVTCGHEDAVKKEKHSGDNCECGYKMADVLATAGLPKWPSSETIRSEGFTALNKSVIDFSTKISELMLKGNDKNFAMAPASIYSALALTAEASSGTAKEELLSALNIDYATLSSNYKYLAGMLNGSASDENDKEYMRLQIRFGWTPTTPSKPG